MSDITSTVTVVLKGQNQGLDAVTRQATNGVSTFGSGVKSATAEVKGLESGLQQLKSATVNVFSGAGLGGAGSIISGLTGPAILATVGLVIGQAMRMAYEFERVSTVAASQLRIGTKENIGSALARVKTASREGLPYNFTTTEMAQAMGALGMAAGVSPAASGARSLARYSFAYRMDPSQVAQLVGPTMAQTGDPSFENAAGAVFKGAEASGPLGRRIQEFVGIATNVLSQLQLAAPGRNVSAYEAYGQVASISQLGGIFGTGSGVQDAYQASQALVQGGGDDVRRALLEKRAGVSTYDIVTGTYRPENAKKIFAETLKEYGNYGGKGYGQGIHNIGFFDALKAQVGESGARTLVGMAERGQSRFGDIYHGFTPQNLKNSGAGLSLDDLIRQQLDTPLSKIDKVITDFKQRMVDDGEKMIHALLPLTSVIPGQLDNIEHAIEAVGIIVAANSLRGMLGGLLGKAAGEGMAARYLGLGPLTAIIATLSLKGDNGGGPAMPGSPAWNLNQGHGRVGAMPGSGYTDSIAWDLQHSYAGTRADLRSANLGQNPNRHLGITDNLRVALGDASTMGWNLGLSAVTQGSHAQFSEHYFGNAADIAMLNGKAIGADLKSEEKFARQELTADPKARIGTYLPLYNYLESMGYGNRVFHDEGTGPHIHVEGGEGDAPDPLTPTSKQTVSMKRVKGGTIQVKTDVYWHPEAHAGGFASKPTSPSRTGGHQTPVSTPAPTPTPWSMR